MNGGVLRVFRAAWWGRFARTALWVSASTLVCAVVLILQDEVYVPDSHYASSALALACGLAGLPLSLVAAHYGGGTRREGMTAVESLSPRGPVRRAWKHLWAPLAWVSVFYWALVGAVAALVAWQGSGGFLLGQVVTSGWVMLVVACVVGFCVARRVPGRFALAVVGVGYLVVAYLVTAIPLFDNLMIPYDDAGFANTQPDTRTAVVKTLYALVLCTTAMAFSSPGGTGWRFTLSRSGFLAGSGLVCTLSLAAWLMVLPSSWVERRPPSTPYCETRDLLGEVTVCTWPSRAAYVPQMFSLLEPYLEFIEGTSLPRHRVYAEPGLAPSIGFVMASQLGYFGSDRAFLPHDFYRFIEECEVKEYSPVDDSLYIYTDAVLSGQGIDGVDSVAPPLARALRDVSDADRKAWVSAAYSSMSQCRKPPVLPGLEGIDRG